VLLAEARTAAAAANFMRAPMGGDAAPLGQDADGGRELRARARGGGTAPVAVFASTTRHRWQRLDWCRGGRRMASDAKVDE
jgi:hypothetical protein